VLARLVFPDDFAVGLADLVGAGQGAAIDPRGDAGQQCFGGRE
jgi:hypothetical protein